MDIYNLEVLPDSHLFQVNFIHLTSFLHIMAVPNPDYHLIGLHTRYSSKQHATDHTPDLTSPLQIGWTARVEAVLEYFQIPHTRQFIQLSEVHTYILNTTPAKYNTLTHKKTKQTTDKSLFPNGSGPNPPMPLPPFNSNNRLPRHLRIPR